MAIGYVIYNPLSGDGNTEDNARLLTAVWDDELVFYDMTHITNYRALLQQLNEQDYVILAGGDGTLNRFINETWELTIPNEIYFFPTGTGNDFAREMNRSALCAPFPISQYLRRLPWVQIGQRRIRFLNAVGFGLDGYCCQEGDRQRAQGNTKVNYTAIAISGLLRSFTSRNARVVVDGKEYFYRNVWIAPVMLGKYYGGGMLPAPQQDRNHPDRTLSVMLFYGAGRLRTLLAFPGIFKGTHIRHKSQVAIHTGHDITVEFDRPTPAQIDGETVPNVTSYRAVFR